MALTLPPQVEQVVQKLDDLIAQYPTITQYDRLKELETKTGYPKVLFFAGIVLFLSTFVTVIGGAKLIVDLLGFVYPAYMSFKAMDSNAGEETQWLTYWVVFSCASIVEGMFFFITRWIPFYFIGKAGVIVWMWHPSTLGAQTVYAGAIRPFMLPYFENLKGTKKVE